MSRSEANEQLRRLQTDPDISAEAETLARLALTESHQKQDDKTQQSSSSGSTRKLRVEDHPFTLRRGNNHTFSQVSRRLLEEIGGVEGLRTFTNYFYQLAFQDSHIDQFIRDHKDPHGERFATWIAEKFGDPTEPWTRERATRTTCPYTAHGHRFQSAHDRSSAHYTAWHSPKRAPEVFGRHFKLDDARVWMRLHFAALRHVGGFERSPAFCAYYMRFIGHFVRIYESTATQFVRESARWSETQANLDRYVTNGRVMSDVIGLDYHVALQALPNSERDRATTWPYQF